MLEIALPIGFLAALVATMLGTRSPAMGAGLVAAGFGVSGALLQFMGVRGTDFTLRAVQIWLGVTLLALLGIALLIRSRAPVLTYRRNWWPWVLAALSFGVFAGSRLLAPGDPAPLSSVGYLITRVSAEDNAKWVDASARLVGDLPLDTWANVGGPLILLLTLSASILGGASQLLYGAVNEVAVASGSPVLSEYLLIIASPFALTPLLAGAARVRGRIRHIPAYLYLLAAVVLWCCVTVLLALGHLTLQYTILVLTLWVASFLRSTRHLRALTSAAVATLAMVWFPLSPVSVAVLVVALAVGLRALARSRTRRTGVGLLIGFSVITILLAEFLWSSISYSLGVNAQASGSVAGGGGRFVSALSLPTLPLFNDPGGTEEVTLTLLALTVFGVLGAIYAYAIPGINTRRTLVRFAPMILLAVYTTGIAVLDFLAVGDGPGYGALKIAFACLIPMLVATLPIAILAVTPDHAGGAAVRVGLVATIVVVLGVDTLLPRAVLQVKPSLWPSTSDAPYWGPAEVRETGEQPLDKNPIGCVYLPPGSSYPSALPWGQSAYTCTRLLTGIAGLGGPAAVITEWQLTEWVQNRSLWDSFHGYFSLISPDVLSRTVILMDEDKQVIGLDSIANLLRRYPPSSQEP